MKRVSKVNSLTVISIYVMTVGRRPVKGGAVGKLSLEKKLT